METPVGATGAAKQSSGLSGTPPVTSRSPETYNWCWGPGPELIGVPEHDAQEAILVIHTKKGVGVHILSFSQFTNRINVTQ